MENNTNITGRKIKNVILGFERKEGSYEKKDNDGKLIRDRKGNIELGYYDNVCLYVGVFNDQYSDTDRGTYFDGFCGQSAKTPLIQACKIKYDDFESVFDVSFADFAADFKEKYLFHPCQIFYDITDFGDMYPIQIKVFESDVFSFQSPDKAGSDGTAEVVS